MKNGLYFFLAALLVIVTGSAFAAAPTDMFRTTQSAYQYLGWFNTTAELCQAVGPVWKSYNPNSPFGPPYTASNPGGGASCEATSGSQKTGIATAARFPRCPGGTAPDTTKPTNEQCQAPPPVCTPGKQYTTGWVPMGKVNAPDMKYPTNLGGCRVYVGGIQECSSDSATGNLQCKFNVTEGGPSQAGESDSPSTPTIENQKPETVPPHNPGAGQGCPKGTVNMGTDSTGGSICGGSGTGPSAPTKNEVKQPPTTVNNADGSSTKTEVTTRTNSDGSTTTTTKKTTTGSDGKVTTSESSVTGDKPATAGGGKGKDDSSDDKNDLCTKNPTLNICRNSSVSGSCDATTCEGDAIQCAMLRQQRKTACEWEKPNDQSNLATQTLGGNDPLKSTLPTKENASQIGFQTLNSNAFLGGGACWSDVTISVMGQSIVVPLSKPCQYIEFLRYVMMTIAALISLKILRGPVLGS